MIPKETIDRYIHTTERARYLRKLRLVSGTVYNAEASFPVRFGRYVESFKMYVVEVGSPDIFDQEWLVVPWITDDFSEEFILLSEDDRYKLIAQMSEVDGITTDTIEAIIQKFSGEVLNK